MKDQGVARIAGGVCCGVVADKDEHARMTAEVLVITGPARSGKTQRVMARFLKVLRDKQPYATLWLAPTWRAAAAIQGMLLRQGLGACFGPGVMTFDRLAQNAIRSASFLVRPLDQLRRRRLVRHLIEQALADGSIRYYRQTAEMGGLVDLVCDAIGALKRQEIWPDRFRTLCESRGMTERDAELADLYESYQASLTEHQLYDLEGRFWVAKQMVLEGRWAPLERLRLVVADGFSEFTVAEHEILASLADRCQMLCVTLPMEEGSRRADLFAGSQATLQDMSRRHPHLTQEWVARDKESAWQAMAHLESTLFGNPRQCRLAPDTAGLEILAASRQLGEIELIGSRIRRLLTAGCTRSGGQPVRPGDIAVVFRSVGDVAPLVREVFGKLGIPVAIESTEMLARVPALAALVAMLRLDVEDWPLRSLLNVVTSNYFQPVWPEWTAGESVVAVEQAVRGLQIPRGRTLLIEQLRRQSAREVREPRGECADNAARSQAEATLRVLTRLAQAFDEMPRRATLSQWSAAWQRLAQETGLVNALEGHNTGEADAWNLLIDALGADDIAFGWMRQPPPELDRTEALASLVDVLRHVSVRGGGGESGRVRVLSAPSVRGLQVPYLFVAGLAERSFPQPDRRDMIEELSEADILAAKAQEEHYGQEMLLFYQVVTRATRQLCLSYPALDEAAQPLAPSPYLDEVELACGLGSIARTEVPDLTPIPRDDEPLTAADFRVKAMATALEGDGRLLAGLVSNESSPGLAENLLAGIWLTQQRQDCHEFGAAEGMLLEPAAQESCAGLFGSHRVFSATELELYAYCPFRYFVERVICLQVPEDLGLEVDYLARGRIVHDALATFHERINQQCGKPTSPASLPPDEYDRMVSETAELLFGRRTAGTVQAAMDEINRRLWKQWIAEYRHQHERYDALWEDCDSPPLPTAFEVSFGHRGGGGPLSTERPLEISADGQTVRIAGRIDRIDLGKVAGRTVFNVIDCKTGSSTRFSAEGVASGRLLQLPLYAMAVEKLMLADQQALPWQAGYWEIQGAGFKAKQTLRMHTCRDGDLQPEAEWEELRTIVAKTIGALTNSMRGGRFPVFSADEHCTRRCPMKTICRINQIRSLEKQWQASAEPN